MAGIDRRPPSLASTDSPSTMRHSSSSDALAVAKPKCGVRFLFFFFRAVFMAAALGIFFVFAGFAAVVLLLVAVGAVRGHERRSIASDDGSGGRALRGLSLAQLRRLPGFEFPSVASPRPRTTPDCAVCLVEFKRGERCRSLPSCGHVFHAGCIDQWLVRSPGCPICRSIVSDMGPEPAETLPANWV